MGTRLGCINVSHFAGVGLCGFELLERGRIKGRVNLNGEEAATGGEFARGGGRGDGGGSNDNACDTIMMSNAADLVADNPKTAMKSTPLKK